MQSGIAAAETVGHNEDLLKQLLLRLPARSLIRFKCVSKLWLSFISSPKFCESHTLQNPIPKFSSATTDVTTWFISLLPNPNLNFIPDPQGLMILQSCNGLLLCTSPADKFTISRQFKFYVVNLTTSRFSEIALPPPSPKPEPARLLSVALAFDPSKSLHYKLVCVSGSSTVSVHREIEIEIYSSETRTWRACKSTHMRFPTIGEFLPGVYCNGRIHWFSRFCWLVHYDIDEGHYGVVGLPGHGFSVERECICFGESGGRLHLIEMYGNGIGLNKLRVLEMGKDYSGWFVKYRVDLNLMTAFPYTPAASCHPFFFLDVEENEEQNPVLVLRIGDKFISYNIRDKSCKTLRDLFSHPVIGWRDAYQYMETLACV